MQAFYILTLFLSLISGISACAPAPKRELLIYCGITMIHPMREIADIIDVWDALSNDRPYHDLWTEEDSLAYIRKETSVHFDPQVAEAFERVLAKTNQARQYDD
ncbi:MAG: hypothetical protein GY755_06290 [Chloroflexi bacterium]|nr:hypothetical protein [Chloroflexota bacterium]